VMRANDSVLPGLCATTVPYGSYLFRNVSLTETDVADGIVSWYWVLSPCWDSTSYTTLM
jgi:hypothetical protein